MNDSNKIVLLILSFVTIGLILIPSFSSPWDNQIIEKTTSVSVGSDTTNCNNVGTGKLIHVVGSNCNAKSLIGSADISITNSTNTITIDYNGTIVSESTVCTNKDGSYSTNEGIYSDGNCNFKRIGEGTGIALSSNSTTALITNTGVISNSCTSPISCSGTNPSSISCSTCITTAPIWERLCANTLGSASSSITCSSFTARKNLYVQINIVSASASSSVNIRFNSDTGNNYAFRYSPNGAVDSLVTSTSALTCNTGTTLTEQCDIFISNNQSQEKNVDLHSVEVTATGAGTTPNRLEEGGKWTNTSAQITTILAGTLSANTFGTGSQMNVWGYD